MKSVTRRGCRDRMDLRLGADSEPVTFEASALCCRLAIQGTLNYSKHVSRRRQRSHTIQGRQREVRFTSIHGSKRHQGPHRRISFRNFDDSRLYIALDLSIAFGRPHVRPVPEKYIPCYHCSSFQPPHVGINDRRTTPLRNVA